MNAATAINSRMVRRLIWNRVVFMDSHAQQTMVSCPHCSRLARRRTPAGCDVVPEEGGLDFGGRLKEPCLPLVIVELQGTDCPSYAPRAGAVVRDHINQQTSARDEQYYP
jgi:hypothetical protein